MSKSTFLLFFLRGLVSSVTPTTSLAVPTTRTCGQGAEGQQRGHPRGAEAHLQRGARAPYLVLQRAVLVQSQLGRAHGPRLGRQQGVRPAQHALDGLNPGREERGGGGGEAGEGGTAAPCAPGCPVLTVTAAAGGDGAGQLARVPALRLGHDAELPLHQPLQLAGRQLAQHLGEVGVLEERRRGCVGWRRSAAAQPWPRG